MSEELVEQIARAMHPYLTTLQAQAVARRVFPILIQSARIEGVRLGIEAAAVTANRVRLSPAPGWSEDQADWWQTGIDDGCAAAASHIRALNPAQIAGGSDAD